MTITRIKPQIQPAQEKRLFSSTGRLFIIGFLFVAAFAIRLYHINEPPLDFHAVRQYHSLIIARGHYVETLTGIPEWRKEVARISMERQGTWEPHIIESLASAAYRLVGGEHFWIPRLLSSIIWLIGGAFLYHIAKQVANQNAALFSTAFYLFLPFAVVASRSFQPDPFMVTGLLAGVFGILRYYEKPSMPRLLLAATLSGFAILIKFVAIFVVVGAFVFAGILTQGFWKWAVSRRSMLFLALSLLPPLIFYSYQVFISESLQGVARGDILPHLLLQPFFWKGWLRQIDLVVGYPAWIAALLGIFTFRELLARGLLVGLWAGYLVFGLVFTYTIHTHDYWNLQLVPIVALSLGPLVALVVTHLLDTHREWRWHAAIGAIGLLALGLSVGIAQNRLSIPGFERKVKMAQEIGEQVGHSTDIVYLSGDYGLSLEYHGELSGKPWPLGSDLEWEQWAGVPTLAAEERFDTWFSKYSPEYFIVEDLREFEQQPDLKRFLSKFSIVSENDDYLIFDLKGRRT